VAEGLHQAVEKDLRLAFFVAGDVGVRPRDKGGELFATVVYRLGKGFQG